jgi:hypothetical protein
VFQVLHAQELGITRAGFLVDRNDHVVAAVHRLVEQLREKGIDAVLEQANPRQGADMLIVELAKKSDVTC